MSTSDYGDLENLVRLARDKTVSGRQTLVATIGDLFLSMDTVLSERERVLMSEILHRLVLDMELSLRKALAERLAGHPKAPRELVVALANDTIEVAHPLLVESEVLQDIELIEIIRNRTLEHQLAITIRNHLSEPVAEALVETDNVDVITRLLENENAKISQKTMEYLVEQSQRVDAYQNPLLRRPDLEPALARRMYWWVSAALRSFILDHFEVDPEMLDSTMEATVKALARAPSEDAVSRAMELAERLAESEGISFELMLRTLRRGEVSLFIALFSKFTGVRLALARRILFEPGGEGLCIACKGAGIDKQSFTALYRLTRKSQSGVEGMGENGAAVLHFYDTIAQDAAVAMLHRWQRDPEFLKAVWQVEQF